MLHDAFDAELNEMPEVVQDEVLALMGLLQQFGPTLGRSRVDTLKGSHEGTAVHGGGRRVAFAFDPKRQAILLVGGDKSGGSEKRFYQQLIRKADIRFDEHVARLG